VPNSAAPALNLWKRHLDVVPDYVWQQTDLETLILTDNELSEISPKIGNLKNLRTLDLGHNQLITLPETLGDLVSLTDFLYLHRRKW
jgi:Leucine-rich repeat (LRR) protein